MASTTDQSKPPMRLTLGGADVTATAVALAILAVSLILLQVAGQSQTLPAWLTGSFPFAEWVNQAEDWLQENYKWLTRGIADAILLVLEKLEFFLWTAPWPAVVLAFVILGLAYGGLPLGLLAFCCTMLWAIFGMWDDAMTTLAMIIVAVSLCVVLGVALGVWCARSDTIEAMVKPILDTMQVMPAFVYLLPAIFFFGTNAASATIAVMIYAFPPVVRLTNLGIRQVPPTMIEAAESFGTTRAQMLWKVQLPQALPSVMLGINQTIMMALALAVFSTFVGAGGGLGDQVWKAITKLQVGWSVEAGLCIVVMAILFDRLSQAMSAPRILPPLAPGQRRHLLLPQRWDRLAPVRWVEHGVSTLWHMARVPARTVIAVTGGPGGWVARHIWLLLGGALIAAIFLIDAYIASIGSYPQGWRLSIRAPVDQAIDWLTVNEAFIWFTKTLKAVVYLYFLKPLDQFFTELPWWYMTALLTFAVWYSGGWRLGVLTAVSLMFCAAAGLWDLTLYTFAATAVSVLFCLIIGVPLGIWAAQSKTVDNVLRPILDLMQTIPTFCYLIPALFFFGGSPTTAIFATVVYAIPPIIRTTALGLRQVPEQIDEATRAFGTTPFQSLTKVKIPLASPSILLGINQTIIMALAMQTVTPLIAGLGLGKEVYDAMNTANTGKGLAAGIGIVLMAIILDRLSQALTATQRRALGLS